MIYGGDSEQAFYRLQEQIIKTRRDDSILAWRLAAPGHSASGPANMTPGSALANSPADFVNCGNIATRERSASNWLAISGANLRVYLSVFTTAGRTIGLLSCGPEHDQKQVVGIPLANTTSEEYSRPRGWHAVQLSKPASASLPKHIQIQTSPQNRVEKEANRPYLFSINGH